MTRFLPKGVYMKKPNNQKETINVIPYDPQWPHIYETEAASIQQALGNNFIAIHHFGSTSVPELAAKPKIDILAVVKSFSLLNIPALEQLGFEYRGEIISTGRYLAKGKLRIHLHLFEEGNPLITRNLTFRDWLRTHPDDREAYAQLKQRLASHHTDGMAYCHAKTDFITQIIEKALQNK